MLLTYQVTNNGTLPAVNGSLEVTVPYPYYPYNDPSGGTLAGGVLTVPVGDLAPGATESVTIRLRVVPAYSDVRDITLPADYKYDQGPGLGLTVNAPLTLPTGDLGEGKLYVDVNVIHPGDEAGITVALGIGGRVTVKIYNTAGEWIQTVADKYPATPREVLKRKWDGKNSKGDYVASGLYIIYAEMPHTSQLAKIAVVR